MDRIPTSHGLLTVGQIFDEVQYGSYAANRGYGLSADRLAQFFGEERGRQMEMRYRAEIAAQAERSAA